MSPSSQLMFACAQPVAGSQLSVVQALPSSQLTGGCWQPAVGSHKSCVQALASLQLSAVPGMHVFDTHVSAPLHTFRSSHWLLLLQQFGTPVCAQRCVLVSQVSVVQLLRSSQSVFRLQQPATPVCTH